MTTRQIISTIAVIIIVIISIVMIIFRGGTHTFIRDTGINTSTTTNSTSNDSTDRENTKHATSGDASVGAGDEGAVVDSGLYSTTTDYYTIEAHYPTLTPGAEDVKSAIMDDVSRFEKKASEVSDFGVARSDGSYQQIIKSHAYTHGEYISYIVTIYEYTGGATGVSVVDTYVFDQAGKHISLGDLVGESAEEQEAFLESVKQVLLNKPAESGIFADVVKDLTLEDIQKSFYLNDTGVAVAFSQYAIAPGAAGVIVATVPYAEVGM